MPIIAARIQPFTFSTLCSMVLLIQSPTPIPENMSAVTTMMFNITGKSKYLTRWFAQIRRRALRYDMRPNLNCFMFETYIFLRGASNCQKFDTFFFYITHTPKRGAWQRLWLGVCHRGPCGLCYPMRGVWLGGPQIRKRNLQVGISNGFFCDYCRRAES